MSTEATVIRVAEDIVTRAMQLQYASVSCRWSEDVQLQRRMPMLHYIACACLPDPERTEEQRHLRAGSHYTATESGVPPGKLVFYARCEVEPLRTLHLIDDAGSVSIGFTTWALSCLLVFMLISS